MTIAQAFGQVLREVRESRHLSQEQLGLESGYHRTYISMLERGHKTPTLLTIVQLAGILEISASEIVKRVEEKINS